MTAAPTTDPPRALRLALLGGARLLRGTDATSQPLERRDAALLAMLVIDGPLSRPHLAASLWPDSDAGRAGNNLRQRLFRLKRLAGSDLIVGDQTLQLAPHVAHDLSDHDGPAPDEPTHRAGDLLGTIDYSGCGELESWVGAARQRWRVKHHQALAAAAERLELKGSIAMALGLAEQLVSDDPTAEHGHRRLMRLHYLRGDRAAALEAFERCRRALSVHLNASPGAETRQLAAVIERSGVLGTPAAHPRAPLPVTVMRPPQLVGRDEEWHAIEQAWRAGKVALLSGEPGMGKSRLLGDLAMAHGHWPVIDGRPGDSGVAYGTLVRWLHAMGERCGWPEAPAVAAELARIVPTLPTKLPAQAAGPLQPARLHRAIDGAVEHWAAGGARVLMVDDLQFADAASIEWLLEWLWLPRPTDMKVLLAVRRQQLHDAVSRWVRDAAPRVFEATLAPLETEAIRSLLGTLQISGLDDARWVEALQRHTGGNPMFILETLAAMLSQQHGAVAPPPARLPLPANIGQLIERRLEQLSAGALRLVRIAAFAGIDFDVALASSVLGRHMLDLAEDWRELERAQLLRGSALAHDLVLETTLRSVPAAIACQLHQTLASLLQERGAEPARIAQHWHDAGQWPQAGAAFLAAADVARSVSQRRLEGDLAGRAADCFRKAGDAAHEFTALAQQLDATRFCDRLDVQVQRARALLRLATTPAQRGAALEAYAATLIEDFRDEEIVRAASEARQIAQASGNLQRELAAARSESRALGRMNRTTEALALVHQFLPAVRQNLGDESGVRTAADFACTLMTCDRVDEAASLFEPALQAAVAMQDWGLAQECHEHMAWVHDYRGEIARSALSYEAAQALAPRLGVERQPARIGRAILGRRYKELGRFTESLALLEHTLAEQHASEEVGIVGVTRADLAGLYLWLGQPGRARAVLSPPSPDATPALRRTHLLASAQIEHWLGRSALPSLDQALAVTRHEGGAVYALTIECERALQLAPEDAVVVSQMALERARALGLHLMRRPLEVAATDALRRSGLSSEAIALARQWTAELRGQPIAHLYTPTCWWVAHQAFEAAGDASASMDALGHARHWIEQVALPQVPPAFRDSFVQRNPVNRSVYAALGRGRTR